MLKEVILRNRLNIKNEEKGKTKIIIPDNTT